LDNAHDSEDDVSKEFYEEQDEKKNVVVSYALLLRKPYEPGYTVMPDCGHLCRTSCRLQPLLANISCCLLRLYHTHNTVQDYKSSFYRNCNTRGYFAFSV
jgi:hypothetical protein